MSLTLTNMAAAQAVQAFDRAQAELGATQMRVSTGLKVGSVKDDPSGWAIAQDERSRVKDWQAVSQSLSHTQSILDVASGATATISDLLGQMQAKVVAYGDQTQPNSQAAIQADVAALAGQISQAATTASFDGVNLVTQTTGVVHPIHLNPPARTWIDNSVEYRQLWYPGLPTGSGTFTFQGTASVNSIMDEDVFTGPVVQGLAGGGVTPGAINHSIYAPVVNSNTWVVVQTYIGAQLTSATYVPDPPPAPLRVLAGPNGETMEIDGHDLRASALSLTNLDWTDPAGILGAIQGAQAYVEQTASYYAGLQNTVDRSQTLAAKQMDVLNAGVSQLVDADMASESARLEAGQAKVQLAAQAMAIANQAPQILLQLFR